MREFWRVAAARRQKFFSTIHESTKSACGGSDAEGSTTCCGQAKHQAFREGKDHQKHVSRPNHSATNSLCGIVDRAAEHSISVVPNRTANGPATATQHRRRKFRRSFFIETRRGSRPVEGLEYTRNEAMQWTPNSPDCSMSTHSHRAWQLWYRMRPAFPKSHMRTWRLGPKGCSHSDDTASVPLKMGAVHTWSFFFWSGQRQNV